MKKRMRPIIFFAVLLFVISISAVSISFAKTVIKDVSKTNASAQAPLSVGPGGQTAKSGTDLQIHINNCPQIVNPGQNLGSSFQVTAINVGSVAVKDVAVDIVLRKTPRCPTPLPYAVYSPNFSNGVLLQGGREFISLAPGESKAVTLNGTNTIPADAPAGKMYLCAAIDAGNKVAETNEGNNCACCSIQVNRPATGRPDLVVSAMRFEKVQAGTGVGTPYWIFNVIITVQNSGGAAGPCKLLLERNMGPGGSYAKACPQFCELDIPALQPGQSLELPPRQFNNSNNFPSLFRATVDSTKVVAESNENNNQRAEKFSN